MTPAQDPFAAYQPSSEPEQPASTERASTNRKVAVLIGGTTLVGASLAGLAWGMSQSDPDESSVSAAVRNDDLRIDKEGDIRTIADSSAHATGTAEAQSPTANLALTDVLTDDDGSTGQTFSQAFRAARDEMGAGKFFVWHDNLYSTNYKEEWESKPEAEQNTYFAGMGLAPEVATSEPIEAPVEDQAPPEAPHPKEANAEDGIPVSIEELKNAEYNSDKITIVDAVSIGDTDSEEPGAVDVVDAHSDQEEWIHHDPGTFEEASNSGMDQFDMPQYDSSMTDDLFDDDNNAD